MLTARNDNKNIIMCLTTGRSGTALLSLLLSLADDITAAHEPEPSFHSVLGKVRHNPDFAIDFVRDQKLPDIFRYPTHNYAETSHLFGKGFFEAFIALRISFRLIVLNRNPRHVAKSLWRVKTVPGRTRLGLEFLLHPDQPGVLHLPNWQKMSDYQLCYWYCLEMERRKSDYMNECQKRGIPVVEVAVEQLKIWQFFKAFCGELGLTVQDSAHVRHAEIAAVKVNSKSKYWPKTPLVPLRWQERKLWETFGAEANDLHSIIIRRYQI